MHARSASGHSSEAPPHGGAPFVRVLRRISTTVLFARWLKPLHRAARALLGVSRAPGALTASEHHPAGRRCAEAEDVIVLSANLGHDWPLHRQMHRRLEVLAQRIEAERANVVLLQEVSRTQSLWVDRYLAERLGMDYFYTRANGHRASIGFEEGLGVFSCLPLRSVQTRPLTGSGSMAHRLALGAELQTGAGPLWVFSAHLSMRPRRNARQVRDLQDWVGDVAGRATAVVGGDFNAHETAPQMIRARQSWLDVFRLLNPEADGATHILRWPWGRPLRKVRLDYLFLRLGEPTWRVIESRLLGGLGEPHSDHHAVMARLRPVPVTVG